ncbi:MAG: nucleotidyl transferase AbiEii/AbiGii toxin family protein [Pirellulales bacterium]
MKDLMPTLFGLAELLEQKGIKYAVMGGLAIRAYAIPRSTEDIDFTLSLDRRRLPELYSELETRNYSIPEPYRAGWVDQLSAAVPLKLVKLKRYVGDHAIDVDLFLAETPFQDEVLKRRRLADVKGRQLWLASPEDLVLLKLAADRPRDWIDIADVFFTQGPLDEVYMRHWAKALDVERKLDRALAQRNDDRL